MVLEKLDNLVKIKQLKKEPPDQNEFDGMVNSAKRAFLCISSTIFRIIDRS